jgi:hypothetical protein
MAKPPFPRFTADQRESMKVLDAHMLRVARPFFWHIGARNDGVPRGASAFILRFERGYVAVTCNHVLEQYEDAIKADARMICQLGTCRVWPEKSLIDRNKKLDIATFEVSEHQLKYIGGDAIDCRSQWPHDIKEGDAIKLTGFLDEERTRGFRQNEYTMPAWGAFGIAESVTGTDILTIYVPDEMFEGFTAPKPPLGLNMSGCSGELAGLVLHGLRGHACVQLRRAGLSGVLISDMVGMSVPMVERYCRFSVQRENATAGVVHLQNAVQERNKKFTG